MFGKYILVGKEPKLVEGLMEWVNYFATHDRAVEKTYIKNVEISTVFLGLDHSFGQGAPLIFETMIFGGNEDGYMDRYSTWDEAIEGHGRAVKLVEVDHILNKIVSVKTRNKRNRHFKKMLTIKKQKK